MCDKKVWRHSSGRLTFSNTRAWYTSHLIYKLASSCALQKRFPKLNKSRISSFYVHLALFIQRMTQLRSRSTMGKYRHLATWHQHLPWKTIYRCRWQTRHHNDCGTEECECEELRLKRGSLACSVGAFIPTYLSIHHYCYAYNRKWEWLQNLEPPFHKSQIHHWCCMSQSTSSSKCEFAWIVQIKACIHVWANNSWIACSIQRLSKSLGLGL